MRQEEDEKRGIIVKDGGRVISYLWLQICKFVYKQIKSWPASPRGDSVI
jgi:hypothetical protein